MRTMVENRQDRLTLVEDAGWARLSATSVAAGILVGYGAFVLLAGLTAAVLGALDVDVDLTGADLGRTGTFGGIVLGLVLFVSWYFGSYCAGRMARRAGVTHGVVVFFIGVLVAVAAGAAVEALGATDDVVAELERLGVPTTAAQWSDIGTVAGIASLVGMLVGCLLGGAAGERWHAKLLARALDPGVGPEAQARVAQQEAALAAARRHEREIDLTGPVPVAAAKTPAPSTTPAASEREAAATAGGPLRSGRTAASSRRRSRKAAPVPAANEPATSAGGPATPASKARKEERSTAS